EARDDILHPGERGQERPRVALAEERAGMCDPEALGAVVLEPGEVVEVRAVRDLDDGATRVPLAQLFGDRLRNGDDGVRPAGDEPGDEVVAPLLCSNGEPLGVPVRMCDQGV